jgi:PIN domain nuclease of toxin-antitoxin system
MDGVLPEEFYEELNNSYYICKKMTGRDVITNYKLPMFHKDPFDRLLVWEAIQNDFVLLSADSEIDKYKKVGLKLAR